MSAVSNTFKEGAQESASGRDTALLAAAAAVLLASIAVFHLFPAVSQLLRVLGVVAAAIVAVLLSYRTALGRLAWGFISDARMEVRKVVWPTRQETIQVTLLVLVMVVFMGVLLWGMDTLLGWGVQVLLGTGE
jgi:preprotein translocase subunit SecE